MGEGRKLFGRVFFGQYILSFWNRDRLNGVARMIYPNGDMYIYKLM